MSQVVKNLIEAVREGNLEWTSALIDLYGHSCFPELSRGYTLLRIAVESNHTAIVDLLFTKGCSPIASGAAEDISLLHLAARNGNVAIVEQLLNSSAVLGINDKNNLGETPLAIAVMRGCLKIVELLLKYGAEINERGTDFDNPLHLAVRNYNSEIAELLLKRGADVNCKGKMTRTPLVIAVERGCLPICELLLKYEADVNEGGAGTDSPLLLAIRNGNIDIVEFLMNKGANVNDKNESGETPLAIAIEQGSLPIVQLLLKYERDFVVNRAGALHLATRNCNVDIVELLLNEGTDVNAQNKIGETPLAIAVKKRCVRVTEILLHNGADLNAEDKFGRTALHLAVDGVSSSSETDTKEDDTPAVLPWTVNDDDDSSSSETDTEEDDTTTDPSQNFVGSADNVSLKDENEAGVTSELLAVLLLSKGANVNAQTKDGRTALHIATKREIDPLVDLLIGHNASVNLADKKGLTALHIAAYCGNRGLTTKLLAERAGVDALTEEGRTALHLAASNESKEIVELLLGSGAQVNLKDRDGDAPLHLTEDPEILVNLLESGAIIDSRNKDGRTALHSRSVWDDESAVATLLGYGADINLRCNDQKTPLDHTFYGDDDDDDDDPGSEHETMNGDNARKLLLRHQVKMKSVGLNVVESQGSARYEEKLGEFRNSCQGEVMGIENEFIDGTNVSYYNILRKDKRFLAKYMDNENVVLASKSEEYGSRFPIYASMIKSRFRRGLARNKLFKQASQIFNSFIDLPDVCAEKILDYLDDEDLAVLIVV